MDSGGGTQEDDKVTANDAVKAVRGSEGVARLAAGDWDPQAIADAAQIIEPALKVAKKTSKGLIIGCLAQIAILVFCILFFINLFNPQAAADTTPVGGTSGGDLANADALTLEQIQQILKNAGRQGKNLLPYAQQIHDSAHKFNINPLLALAFFQHDSGYGSAGAGKTCRNPGNISERTDKYKKSGAEGLGRCDRIYGGSHRWQAFSTYGDGAQAQMWLLRTKYLDDGLDSIEELVARYAPDGDGSNNEAVYVATIKKYMKDHAGGK
jgi:hypothetical protein